MKEYLSKTKSNNTKMMFLVNKDPVVCHASICVVTIEVIYTNTLIYYDTPW